MKIKFILIFLSIFFLSHSSFANKKYALNNKLNYYYNEGGFDPDRLLLGGSLGMNFFDKGKGYNLYINPTIGYLFGRFQLGISGGYNLYRTTIPYNNGINGLPEEYKFTSNNYSASLFTRFLLLGPLFVHVEPGYNFYKILDDPAFTYEQTTGLAVEHSSRISVPSALVGGGFVFALGDRISFIIYGLYDLIQDKRSPYFGLPIIQGGFNFGNFR